jgi:hypothetical protein
LIGAEREQEAVLAAVRSYFEAMWANLDVSGHATGDLRTMDRLQWSTIPPGDTTADAAIDRLEVNSIDGGSALVDLVAHARYSASDARYGDLSFSSEYSGPVVVRRDEGGWKVADFVRNGRSVLSSVFLAPTGAGSAKGLKARILAGELRGDQTSLFFDVRNDTQAPIGLARALVERKRFGLFKIPYLGAIWGRRRLEPGEQATINIGWSVGFAIRTRKLPVVLTALGEGVRPRVLRIVVRLGDPAGERAITQP